MKRSGYADLPLHGGRVPRWLSERMARLGGAIIEAIAMDYGRNEVITRLSDPAWFQSLGCVLGMDWHSSGITTSVMGALKSALNPMANDLGIYVCGGRGKHSRKTPDELLAIADKTGLNGTELVRSSRLSAKVDNTAIQDGFQIYLHSFVVTKDGEWAVIQQGMNGQSGYARRYHWHSSHLKSFVETPHAFVYGRNQGSILNLTAKDASPTKSGILDITEERPEKMLTEIKRIFMPRHHEVRNKDVDLKRLGSVLALANDLPVKNFEELLLVEGLGPRTLQSLTLVSEVIHGTPSRFSDPARYSFAHGGKDGHPFPVPTKTYDESIDALRKAIEMAKLGNSDKAKAIQALSTAAQRMEKDFIPNGDLQDVINHERKKSWRYGGKTVYGDTKPPADKQLRLFD
ncbi:MAG: DUF763 domain-containing protein [Cyclobacteriaceae bacterium]